MHRLLQLLAISIGCLLLCHCGSSESYSGSGSGSVMGGPTAAVRQAQIAAEPKGSHFIGRRYYIRKTRFWGYVRKPGQSWKSAQLVMVNESKKSQPDRLPEQTGSPSYGYDQNFEYKLNGYFTGEKVYDPNSNQVLPEFMLTGYKVLNRNPGWIFTPQDRYDPHRPTLRP